jgi:hypothetical protein
MKLVKFIDSIGRTILGEEVSSSSSTLNVKNPVMINVFQQQNGQMQVQLLPLFFAEFIEASSRADGSVWSYNPNNIVLGEVNLDSKLIDQYTRIFSGVQAAPTSSGESVIKLFDE